MQRSCDLQDVVKPHQGTASIDNRANPESIETNLSWLLVIHWRWNDIHLQTPSADTFDGAMSHCQVKSDLLTAICWAIWTMLATAPFSMTRGTRQASTVLCRRHQLCLGPGSFFSVLGIHELQPNHWCILGIEAIYSIWHATPKNFQESH